MPSKKPKKSKTSTRTKNPKPLFRFIKEHWGKFAFIMTAIFAALGWHLATCITERTQQAKEFRESVVALRVTDEKLTQDFATLSEVLAALVEYVKQERASISEIEKRKNQMESMAQITSTDCAAREEIHHRFRSSHETVTRRFLLLNLAGNETEDEDWRGECGLFLEMSQGLYSPNPTKLINDSEYRRKFVEFHEPFIANYEKQITELRASQRRRDSNAEKLLAVIEDRNRNVAKSIWDCLRILF